MAQNTDQVGVSNLAEELKNLLAKNIDGNLQLLDRLSNMARETARRVTAGSNRPQPPGSMVNRLVKLNMSYLSLITKHGLAFADEMATITARALGATGSAATVEPAATPDRPRAEVQLSARIGQTATTTFLVENSRPQALDVSFEASQILSREGEPITSPVVRFKPSRLRIKAGAQSTVQVLIKVTSEFKADGLYFLRIRVIGFEQKEILIALQVLPPADTAPPDKPVKKGQSRAKRRQSPKRRAASR